MSQPQNLSVVDDTIHHELTLGWDSVSGVDGYNIYRAESSGSNLSDYSKVDFSTESKHTDGEVKSGEKYYYRVTSVSSSESSPSAEVSAVTPLLPPKGLSVSNILPYSADISWTSRDQNGDQRIYAETGGTKTDESGSLSTATESYTLTGLQDDTTYTVSVQAETEHATSEDVALTFDVGPNETVQGDSHYVILDTEKVAGTLQILNYE